MTSTFRGWGGVGAKMRYYLGCRGLGGSECSGSSIFIFSIKENWICAMTRHHVELLTRNLPIDSGVRQ